MPHFRVKELQSGIRSYRIQVKAKDIRTGKWFAKVKTWRQPFDMPNEVADYEVKRIAIEFEDKVRKQARGLLAVDDKISFIEFAYKWLEGIKQTQSMNYYIKGSDAIRKMSKYFGEIKLSEVSPLLIQDYLNQLISTGYVVSRARLKNDLRSKIIASGAKFIEIMKRAEISKTILWSALRNENILVSSAEKICRAMNIKFDEYFDLIEEKRMYAKESVVRIKRIISAILAMAKRKRIIEHNFATSDYIEPIKGYKRPIKVLSVEDAKKLVEYMENNEVNIVWKTCIYLALLLGLRRGEIAGLEWKDINFERKLLSVRRSVQDIARYGLITKEPKTENSVRVISMPDMLICELRKYQVVWEDRKKLMGDRWKDTDRLFCSERGTTISPGLFLVWLKKILIRAELPTVSLHSLRHSNITMQLVSGVDIKTVSARAGHARASTTSDIYSHYLKEPDYYASQVIDKIFKG